MAWHKDDVFGLFVGHGMQVNGVWDSGAAYGKYTEAELMLPIVKVAVKYLRKSGVKVLTDADTGNDKNMTATINLANKKKVKKYMSVHCDYSGATSGVMPLYRSISGMNMAVKVGKYCAKYMGLPWKGAKKRTNLGELNQTDMTAVVFETGAIKADLKVLKGYKKYGKVLAKAICKYLGVKFYVSNRIKAARKMAYVLAYANQHKFGYEHDWKKCATTWKGAKKVRKMNCHLAMNYALQLIGLLKGGQIFWCNVHNIVCKGKGTRKMVMKNFKIMYPDKIPKNVGMKRGDVTCSNKAHTQGYAGWKGDYPLWYSWSQTDKGKKQPRHKKSYDRRKVTIIMRPKG